jgi:putative ABC transport system permease protein
MMNVKAMERLGYKTPEEAVNSYVVTSRNVEYKIVGVVDDFYYQSIKNEPVPTVLRLTDQHKSFLTLKVAGTNTAGILQKLKTVYSNYFPDQPFDYMFLDDKMRSTLKPDKTFLFVFSLFSILAILIAVIGIVGLILITINQRMKEIGVRKVLGSSLLDVSKLLAKEVVSQIIVAVVIAIPLAWYGYKNWFLDTYINSIELRIWMFLVPVLVLFSVVFLVIHLVSRRAYSMTLSEVLQNE